MIYVTDVERSLGFYRDALGFEVIEVYPGDYARLRSPRGTTSIALHAVEEAWTFEPTAEGMRLYFEVEGLDDFCRALERKGVKLRQPPEDMPWGWRHAYLDDPDGHEISLYWAGEKRFRPTRAEG